MRRKWTSEDTDLIVDICKESRTVPEAMGRIQAKFDGVTVDSIISALRRQNKPMPKSLVGSSAIEEVELEDLEEIEEDPPTLRSQRHPTVLPPSSKPKPDRFWVDAEDPDDFSPIIQSKSDWVSKRVLLVPDTHRPYHSRRAFNLMLTAAYEIVRPDTIVILGDFGDFFSISAHDKDPKRATRLREELDDVAYGLDALGSIPGVRRKIYCGGNHEFRQDRYISKWAPELDGLVVGWADYLRLEERGWEFVPYKRLGVVGNILVTHETGIGGVYASKRTLDLTTSMGATDVAFGHTHRLGMSTIGSFNGRPRLSVSCGWLGSHKSADYVHAITAFSTYNHGFAYAVADPTGHLIPGLAYIYGKHAHLMGQTITLEDR